MGLDTKSGTEMDHRVRNRVISVVGGLGVVAILLGLGYLFSASSVAQQVASSAQSLHEANAAAGSTALSRASAAQAVVFSIDYELGVASEEARDIAIAEASKTLADTRRWTAIFKENSATPALGELLEQFSVTGEQVVSLLVAGSSLDAERVRTEILEPLYGDLASSLGDRQETILAESSSRRTVRWNRWLDSEACGNNTHPGNRHRCLLPSYSETVQGSKCQDGVPNTR